MRNKTLCFLMFLIFLLLGSELLAQPGVDFCPVKEGEELIEAPPYQEKMVPFSKDYTVPRKQVLLEIFTRPT